MDLLDLLGKYAQDREHYPTLESFMPHIVAFFEDAAAHVDEMIRRRGRLEIEVQPATGVLVTSVTAGSVAERAGIHHGDIITAINGQGINNRDAFIKRIASAPGTTVTLSILRDGHELQVSAKVEEYFESGP